jgi:hypothetical protein
MSLSYQFSSDFADSYPPSGYAAFSFQHQCRSTMQIGTDTILYKHPSQDINGNWIMTSSPATLVYTATATGDWAVIGDGIPIWYQASDQVAFTVPQTSSQSSQYPLSESTQTTSIRSSSYPTSSLQLSPSSPANITPNPSTRSSTSSKPTPTGLSTVTNLGIGIGVAVGIIAIIGIAGLCIFKRRNRYYAGSTDVRMLELQSNHKSELGNHGRPVVHELYSHNGENNQISPGRCELHD